ncbi:MAG TPA: hypothetical protein VFB99_10535 [Vicinamibacterales bacterium]|jgi:hypothetical protein|nr:hypothetical protein [Vicinamibacterales bacterium]
MTRLYARTATELSLRFNRFVELCTLVAGGFINQAVGRDVTELEQDCGDLL